MFKYNLLLIVLLGTFLQQSKVLYSQSNALELGVGLRNILLDIETTSDQEAIEVLGLCGGCVLQSFSRSGFEYGLDLSFVHTLEVDTSKVNHFFLAGAGFNSYEFRTDDFLLIAIDEVDVTRNQRNNRNFLSLSIGYRVGLKSFAKSLLYFETLLINDVNFGQVNTRHRISVQPGIGINFKVAEKINFILASSFKFALNSPYNFNQIGGRLAISRIIN